MAVSPTVRINVSGARGSSFADVLRQTGAYGVLPTDTDAQAISKLVDDVEASTLATSRLYANTSLGIAATSDGQYFSVPDTDEDFLILYRNASGVATEVNRYPSKVALQALANEVGVLLPGPEGLSTPAWPLFSANPDLIDPAYGDYTLTEDVVNLFIIWGQSWAQGNNQIADAAYSPVALHPSYSRCPSVGVNPRGAAWTTLTDLREGINPTNSKESIATRADDWIQQKAIAITGNPLRTIWIACAEGGNPFQTLKKGTPRWANLIADIKRANDIVRGEGRRMILRGICVLHGEQDYGQDTPRETYKRDLTRYFWQINEAASQITGQPEQARGFTYQTNRGGGVPTDIKPAFAQLDVHGGNGEYVCIGPVYYAESDGPRDGSGTGSHLKTSGYAEIGEHFGEVISKELFGGGFEPLRVTGAQWTSYSTAYTIRLQYNHAVLIDTSSAIVDDTRLNGTYVKHGVSFHDDASTHPNPTGVSMVAAAMVGGIAGQVVSFTGTYVPTPGDATASTVMSQFGVDGPTAITVTVNGVVYGADVHAAITLGTLCNRLVEQFPGATTDGVSITYPGGATVSAVNVYTSWLDVTLSGPPVGKRPRAMIGTVTSGDSANGRDNGARTTIRRPLSYGTSATGAKKYHWACVQAFDLSFPGIPHNVGPTGVGSRTLLQNISGGSISGTAGSDTLTGEKLTRGSFSASGAWTALGALSASQTWRNAAGTSIPNNSIGMFERIA